MGFPKGGLKKENGNWSRKEGDKRVQPIKGGSKMGLELGNGEGGEGVGTQKQSKGICFIQIERRVTGAEEPKWDQGRGGPRREVVGS